MRGGWCAFALGVGLLQCQAVLPGEWRLAALAGLTVLLLAGAQVLQIRGSRRIAWWIVCIAAVLGGFGYAALRAHLRLAEVLPLALDGEDVDVSGWIAGLPRHHAHGVSFSFAIDESVARHLDVPSLVQLGWPSWGGAQIPALEPGARWHLRVRLRRPYAHANPGLNDFEAMWLAHGIRARGQVIAPQRAQRLDVPHRSFAVLIDRLRARIAARIGQVLADGPRQGIVMALAIGEQGDMTPEDRDILRRTGTSHLVAVSGSHVALAGGLCAGCVAFAWRRVRWRGLAGPLRWPTHKAGALGMLLGVGAYAALAGFNLPVQRACWMVVVMALTVVAGRRVAPSTRLVLALAIVLLADPWAVLMPGFWLSFGAVAAILLTIWAAPASRIEPEHGLPDSASEGDEPVSRWRRWGAACKHRLERARHTLMAATRVQCAVTLALIPLTIGWFAQVSLIAPFANAIAIPWIELLSTPCALAGVVLPAPLDAWALRLSHTSLDCLMRILGRLAAWPHAQAWMPVPETWVVAVSLGAVGWMLAPRGWPLRGVMPLGWLPLVLPAIVPSDAAPPGAFRLTALDAGPGPAVLLETARHSLLFGAGSGPVGADIVVPYLHAHGVTRLDAAVIAQIGATRAASMRDVLGALPVTNLYGPDAQGSAAAQQVQACTAVQTWVWDGVTFEMFGVSSGPSRARTGAICVLRVSVDDEPGHSALLAGDLDARAEHALIERHGAGLPAGVLLVPSQGSRAASTKAFLEAVAPKLAVIQVAYPNRLGYPDQAILARYHEHGATVLRTDQAGAVRIVMPAGVHVPQSWRTEHRRYWSAF